MRSRPLVAHVGCSKTGTSSLQAGLWRSADAVRRSGVALPFVGRRAHRQHLLDPFGWRPAAGFVGPWDEDALRRTSRRLARAEGERVLISNEDLVELGPRAIDRLIELGADAGLDLHLVVTLRDWAQQIPSEYQQFLRHGMAESFPDFIAQVREKRGRWGEHFWRRQDPVGILERWRAVDPTRVAVVVVPSFSADPDGVFRLVGEAAAVDPSLISRPTRAVNPSHGVVEAEVFRRVNAALPEEFADYSPAYKKLIRIPFSMGGVLPTEASGRLALPDTELGWVGEYAGGVIDRLRGHGCRVLGDPEGLLPSPSRTAPYEPVDEAEIARVSVETIARFADLTRQLLDEPDDPPEAAAALRDRSRLRGMFRR